MPVSFTVDQTGYPSRVRSTLDVGSSECRFPIDNAAKDDWRLCREPVVRGSYCLCHAMLAYTGTERLSSLMPPVHRALRRAA